MPTARRSPSAREDAAALRDARVVANGLSTRRERRRAASVALTLVTGCALLVPLRGLAAPAAPDVNAMKAEMLWNIAKFIQWPDVATASTPRPQMVFTILGEDELAVGLAQIASTKTINGRPVFVRFARRAQDARGSQILYVASSETSHLDAILSEVSGAPVLTVADTPAFAAHGGMVGLTADGDRVRFEINLGHAEHAGLRISAKLLALARVVDSGP